ncbi:MAG: class I SAM-dependent methyltransferase [Desulfurococcales archaeon]|nr:class I SAM-dependent methyltransferase [Desulfurococcales archaeon]
MNLEDKEWFKKFFDELYYETYSVFENEERNEKEARFIVESLGLPKGSSVLDLGCGYGRHAVYLGKWGYRVVCLDLSKFLLGIARDRISKFRVEDRVELVSSDMRSMEYKSEFDGVYMFFTTFGYSSDEENLEVLRRVSRALRPGGAFLVDLINPIALLHNVYNNDGRWRTWYEAGNYIVLEDSTFDILRGRLHVKRIFKKKDSTLPLAEKGFTLRIYTYWELNNMLEKAGLKIVKALGSYKGDEYKPSSPRLIIIAQKITSISS